MNEIKTQNWSGHDIRFIEVDGEWWAVAKDIARAMRFRDADNATKKMPERYKGMTMNERYGLNVSVSDIIYSRYEQ